MDIFILQQILIEPRSVVISSSNSLSSILLTTFNLHRLLQYTTSPNISVGSDLADYLVPPLSLCGCLCCGWTEYGNHLAGMRSKIKKNTAVITIPGLMITAEILFQRRSHVKFCSLWPRTKHDTRWAHPLLICCCSYLGPKLVRFFLDSTAVNCSYFFLDTATLILRFLCEAQRVQSCCLPEQNIQIVRQTTLIGGILPILTPTRDESIDDFFWLGALIGRK